MSLVLLIDFAIPLLNQGHLLGVDDTLQVHLLLLQFAYSSIQLLEHLSVLNIRGDNGVQFCFLFLILLHEIRGNLFKFRALLTSFLNLSYPCLILVLVFLFLLFIFIIELLLQFIAFSVIFLCSAFQLSSILLCHLLNRPFVGIAQVFNRLCMRPFVIGDRF